MRVHAMVTLQASLFSIEAALEKHSEHDEHRNGLLSSKASLESAITLLAKHDPESALAAQAMAVRIEA